LYSSLDISQRRKKEIDNNLQQEINRAINGNIKLNCSIPIFECEKQNDYAFMFNYWSKQGYLKKSDKKSVEKKRQEWKNRKEIISKTHPL